MQSKVMVTMLSLFAELERDLISQRTKRALEAKKAAGVRLGRPKGSTSKSKLDGKEGLISDLLVKKVSISSIAKILEVSRGTVENFIVSRNLRVG
jgi:DNA invertase Pin-like site-specific DNA recombinase